MEWCASARAVALVELPARAEWRAVGAHPVGDRVKDSGVAAS